MCKCVNVRFCDITTLKNEKRGRTITVKRCLRNKMKISPTPHDLDFRREQLFTWLMRMILCMIGAHEIFKCCYFGAKN